MSGRRFVHALTTVALGSILMMTGVAQASPADHAWGPAPGTGELSPRKGESEYLTRVGSWPYGQALAVTDDPLRDLIFLGSGGVVLILDVSDLANPQLLSEDLHTLGIVLDMAYDSDTRRLFIACGVGGLEIWDVSDPAAPEQLCVFEVLYYGFETPVENVEIYGKFALLNCSWGYVRSVDVSDPTDPVVVGGASDMGNPANDIYLSEDGLLHTVGAQAYARYRIDSDGSLHANGYYDNWVGISSHVAGTAEAAFVDHDRYLYIIDPVNPYYPVFSVIDIGRNMLDIDVQGEYLYYTQGGDPDLVIYDVSDLYNPFLAGTLTMSPLVGARKLEVVGNHAYVAGGYEGLRTVDVSNPAKPDEVGSYETFSVAWTTYRSGDYAYLAENDDGMVVLDLTDPTSPVLAGQYDTPGTAYDAALAGSYACVADWDGGLRIADISDPTNPAEVGVAPMDQASVVSLSGEYAYVIDNILNEPDWLRVIDISDPSDPTEVGALYLQYDVLALDVSGNYLYAAADDYGMRVLDISDPHNPVEVGFYVAPFVRDVKVAGHYAYLASPAAQGGFLTLDISDPSGPTLVSSYSPPGFSPFDVALVGDFAYLTDPVSQLLYLMHVGDPANPVELETYTPPGDLFDVFGLDSLVYISDGSAGLLILENELYSTPAGGVAWEVQDSGTDVHLRDVHFVDASTGWGVGDDGTILTTGDGGENWLPQTSGTGEDLFAVYFADAATGWAGGREGVILKTTDGGDRWVPRTSGTDEQIRSMEFIDHNVGWAVGTGGTIRKTVDGGDHWLPQSSGTSGGLASVSFVDALHGWIAVQEDGLLLKTTDGGTNWQTVSVPTESWPSSVSFVNQKIGWVATWGASVFKTPDGGATWIQQYSDPETPYSGLNCIHFIDPNTGWVVGAIALEGQSFRTTDGGERWIEMHGGREHYLQSVHFVDEYNGWAVGQYGTILRAAGAPTSVSDDSGRLETQPGRVVLHSNYPNPFNPATTIRYELPERANVTLKIYNILGQEVRTLIDTVQLPGRKSIVWDGKDGRGQLVSSGLYVCSLQVGSEVKSKKMMLLR